MKIPFKPSLMSIRRKSVKWIILHHTIEMYKNPEAKIDNSKIQVGSLKKGVLELKQADVNYNYVIDKIKDDYEAITCRPFVYMCEWDDIDPMINERAIHIALLGNYDIKQPEKRMYEVLAYRLLNPFMKMFALSPDRIKFHRDVSIDEISCPGELLDSNVVIAQTRRFVLK